MIDDLYTRVKKIKKKETIKVSNIFLMKKYHYLLITN